MLHLENGNTFEIVTHHGDEGNSYIQKILLNGVRYEKNYITHDDIVKGGKVEFYMGPKPNKAMAK